MSRGPIRGDDLRIQSAIAELRDMILERYPEASFAVSHGDDPEGIYLNATVDLEDVDVVLDVVRDRLFATQVEEALPLYVIPLQPVERVVEGMRAPPNLTRRFQADFRP
jgi:hypothetical protein